MQKLCLFAVVCLSTNSVLAVDVDYVRDIKPLLSEKCAACHGALKQEADLRLDAGKLIHAGGGSGQVIDLQDSAASLLIQRIATEDADLRMPPLSAGTSLEKEQIELLTQWIADGAKFPQEEPIPAGPDQHWAYQQPVKTLPEGVSQIGENQNPIDVFIDGRLTQAGLSPLPAADKATLLRRLYLDLTGLTPTRQQLQQFVADDSADAVQKVVDELLDSPAYGERWGRHWMDVWRYSDWDGFKNEVRGSQRHIWRWRDWIIESLNDDKGYDQMIVEMLAGDEVSPEDDDVIRATGFLARSYHNSNRDIWLDATVEHTAKAFLGMTINCARCHDHKYDPIGQTEYYSFRAIFEPHNVRTDQVPGQSDVNKDGLVRVFDEKPDVATYLYVAGNEKLPDKENPMTAAVPTIVDAPFEVQPVELPDSAVFPALREFIEQEALAAAEKRLTTAKTNQAQLADKSETCALAVKIAEQGVVAAEANLASLKARWAADKSKFAHDFDGDTEALAAAAATSERNYNVQQAELVKLQRQRDVETATNSDEQDANKKQAAIDAANKALKEAEQNLQKAVEAQKQTDSQYTSVGKAYPKSSTGRRLALARWMTDTANPLTARVAVNQIWMRHFGEPLVANVFDFGLRSAKPVHAELLDWLSVELMENQWSMKHVHRLILNSRAYQRASSGESGLMAANQAIDADNQLLWRSNVQRLDAELVRDSLLHVAGNLDRTLGGPVISFMKGEESNRRSIYIQHAYEKQMEMLVVFDAAAPVECYRRSESIIPQQALTLSNSPLAIDMSRKLAADLSAQLQQSAADGTDVSTAFIEAAFETVLGRSCTDEERTVAGTFLIAQTQRLTETQTLTSIGGKAKSQISPSTSAEQRARENLIHVLMNHNDFITIR